MANVEDLAPKIKHCIMFLLFCIVSNACSGSRPTHLTTSEGTISSQSADTKGCGSSNSPWIISAKPGQTINISIVDFSADSGKSNMVTCPAVYGSIRERALGINHTICGGRHRERALYTSKTNAVEIQIKSRNSRGEKHFLLKYSGTRNNQIKQNFEVIFSMSHFMFVVSMLDFESNHLYALNIITK
jgi:hypothetical protein